MRVKNMNEFFICLTFAFSSNYQKRCGFQKMCFNLRMQQFNQRSYGLSRKNTWSFLKEVFRCWNVTIFCKNVKTYLPPQIKIIHSKVFWSFILPRSKFFDITINIIFIKHPVLALSSFNKDKLMPYRPIPKTISKN